MASILSGPIPQHPMFNKSGTSNTPRMGPRIKPEASSFASHGQKGTIGNVFEVTGTSCFASSNMKISEYQPSSFILLFILNW